MTDRLDVRRDRRDVARIVDVGNTVVAVIVFIRMPLIRVIILITVILHVTVLFAVIVLVFSSSVAAQGI